MAAITSRSVFPRKSATPYSVTTMSRIGELHRGHAQPVELRLGHLAQRSVEGLRAEEEGRVQHRAVHLAPDDPGFDQRQKGSEEHLADPIEACPERRMLGRRRRQR